MKTKYPLQIASVIHKNSKEIKTLGIDSHLTSPLEDNKTRKPTPPLEMHEGFSVYKGHLIISKDTETNVLNFNIPAEDVPFIHTKTKIAISDTYKEKYETKMLATILKIMAGKTEKTDADIENQDLAFSTTIVSGKLKGKTPAQALMEDSGNVNILISQKDFLSKNLSNPKFKENNEKQIKAINVALKLNELGKLTGSDSFISTEIKPDDMIIIEYPPKNFSTMDEDGFYDIYQVKITYSPSMGLPFCIDVMNCKAPIDKTKGNSIILSGAKDKIINNIRLTSDEWYKIIDKMKAHKIMFENYTYKKQIDISKKISLENYDESKK